MTGGDLHNEQLISAYLDGELTSEERQYVEQLLETNADYRQLLADLRALVDDLQQLPKLSLDEGFVGRVADQTRQVAQATAEEEDSEDISLELISAYLDDELSADDLACVQQQLESDDPSQEYLQQLRALDSDLRALPKQTLDDSFADRVLRRAERTMLVPEEAHSEIPSETEPVATPARRPEIDESRTAWRGFAWSVAAVAAAIVLAVVLGRNPESGPTDIAVVPNEGPEVDVESLPPSDPPEMAALDSRQVPSPHEVPDSGDPGNQVEPPPRHKPEGDWPVVLAMQQNVKQRFILVYEVSLTSVGVEQGAFARLLNRHNIGFRDTVAVGEEEQRSLLKRRYLEGARIASPAQKGMDEIRLYLVSCTAKEADSLYHDLTGGPPGFASFSLNLTSGEAGGGVLNRVCEASDIKERSNEAVRLAASFAMLSKTARNLGVFGTIEWIDPELMQPPTQSGSDAAAEPAAEPDDTETLPNPEDLQCELLFVVRNMQTP